MFVRGCKILEKIGVTLSNLFLRANNCIENDTFIYIL
jgi:hypothetical protein